jgi:hypothetical protein
MTIEGEPLKPYRLYRTGLNDEIIEMVAEADTMEEVRAHKGRLDWRYAIYHNGKRVD